jgi:hypothetical protein
MLLMEAYGIGPHTRSIINALWEHELMVPKSGDCFGIPLHPTCGVRQGDEELGHDVEGFLHIITIIAINSSIISIEES